MTGVRVLGVGDNHFAVKDAVDADNFIAKLQVASRRLQPDCIVLLGDLMDSHERCHMDAHIRAVKLLTTCASYAPTFFVIGNHDRRNNSDFMTSNHFFTGINIPGLTIVDKAMKASVKSRCGRFSANFLFCPYVAPGRFYEALDTIDLQEVGEETWRSPMIDAMFCHQEFKGVQMGPIKSEQGDYWDETWPLVIAGHIHEYQLMQSNLLYPGTPMQQTFSESPDKAVVLFDFNTDISAAYVPIEEVKTLEELVPTAETRCKYARIKLGLRVKKTVTLNVSELASFKPDPSEQVKLVVKGTVSELRALNKSKTLNKFIAAGVKVSQQPLQEERKRGEEGIAIGVDGRPKPFLTLFRELIAEDEELLPAFDTLFAHA